MTSIGRGATVLILVRSLCWACWDSKLGRAKGNPAGLLLFRPLHLAFHSLDGIVFRRWAGQGKRQSKGRHAKGVTTCNGARETG